MPALTEEQIRVLAQERVEFRRHAFAYVVVNVLLAAIWFFTTEQRTLVTYWPVWSHLGWGVGLAIHGYNVRHRGHGGDEAIEREMEKIRRQQADP